MKSLISRITLIWISALLAGGCATYVSTSTSPWEHKTLTQRRIIRVIGEAKVGPATPAIGNIHLGGEPAVEIFCSVRKSVRAEVETKTIHYRIRKNAQATLLVKNALNENILVYGLGWFVLAPVWVPFQYYLRTHGAASDAVESPPGIKTIQVGDNDCIVEVVQEREVDDEDAEVVVREEDLDPETLPLRDAAVDVLVNGETFRYRTDFYGRFIVPLRYLLMAGDKPGNLGIRITEGTNNVSSHRLSLLEDAYLGRLESALAFFIRPDPPEWTQAPVRHDPLLPVGLQESLEASARSAVHAESPGEKWSAAVRLPRLALYSGRIHPVPGEVNEDFRQAVLRLDRDRLPEALMLCESAISIAPWWPGAHLLRSHLQYQKGDLDAALFSLSLAWALTPEGSREAVDRAALFTAWAAKKDVEIFRAKPGARTESELMAMHVRFITSPGISDTSSFTADLDLEVERSSFGARPLSMPPIFHPGLPSLILLDREGRLFFWRFIP